MTVQPCAVSVIVPTYQRRDRVLALVRSMARQTAPMQTFEVIVSIDGSTDGTREALLAAGVPYRLRVLHAGNRGRAAALNAGIQAAAGDLLVFLDDDMEPDAEFVVRHQHAHRHGGRIGVMGAVPMAIASDARPATRYVADKFNGHLDNLARPDYQRVLTDFYSGNFSIRRDVLAEVGGFDEAFRIYGNEDLELSFRLHRAGVTIHYDSGARATQHHDKDFAALARDSMAEGRTAVLFVTKHPEVFEGLKLGGYRRGPLPPRLVRNLLLLISRYVPSLPAGVVALETRLVSAGILSTPVFYRLSLGYFYWLGVRAAIDELPAAERHGPLGRLAADLRR